MVYVAAIDKTSAGRLKMTAGPPTANSGPPTVRLGPPMVRLGPEINAEVWGPDFCRFFFLGLRKKLKKNYYLFIDLLVILIFYHSFIYY